MIQIAGAVAPALLPLALIGGMAGATVALLKPLVRLLSLPDDAYASVLTLSAVAIAAGFISLAEYLPAAFEVLSSAMVAAGLAVGGHTVITNSRKTAPVAEDPPPTA